MKVNLSFKDTNQYRFRYEKISEYVFYYKCHGMLKRTKHDSHNTKYDLPNMVYKLVNNYSTNKYWVTFYIW